MGKLYLSLAVLVLLSHSTFTFRFSLSPEYKNIKICRSRNTDCRNNLNAKLQLRYYQLQYSQCTHIIGNLVLCNLKRTENGTDPDLSFLESIREVSGYVLLSGNEVKQIPLTSLRIIRGRLPYDVEGNRKGSLVIFRNAYNKSIGLEILDLRSLTTIQQHDIIIWDNPLLCYFAYRIDVPGLFNSYTQRNIVGPEKQYTSHSGCVYEARSNNTNLMHNVTCHPSCRRHNGEAYCWGPEENQCQLQAKCENNTSRYCLMSGRHDIKCDDACLGGCTETTSKCWACRQKLNGGTCTGSCPPKMILGEITSRQEPNPDFKFDLHNICVKNCPDPFLKMDTVCVIECDIKTTIPVNGSCVPCSTSPCATHCTKEQIFGKGFALLTSKSAKMMEKCEYYSGPIYVNENSFGLRRGVPMLKLSDLWNLRNVKEVVGYIYLDFQKAPAELTNLTFFQSLYKVTAEFGQGLSLGIALSIYNGANVEFLGFKNLRYMDTEAFMENMTSLCYQSALEKLFSLRTKGVKDKQSCEKEGHLCHSECLPFSGCWGPGPSMCAHCCGFQAGEQCVSQCSEAPGFYTPPGLVSVYNSGGGFRCPTLPLTPNSQLTMSDEEINAAIVPAQQCIRCHEECSQTCSGPMSTNCIGPCKHVSESGKCVGACSSTHYLDESSKECLRCQDVCLHSVDNRNLPEGVTACSGPGNHLGLGGCTFCQFIQKDANTSQYACLAGGCPAEHFGKVTHLSELDIDQQHLSMDNQNMAIFDMKECEPCHPLCESCVGHGTHESVCLKCRKWTYKSECVETCPMDDTYVPSENATTEELSPLETKALKTRQCLLCHRQCAGGCFASGLEHCRNCRYAKIITDRATNQFICNSTCPPEQPHKMDNTNLCLDETQYEDISGANRARTRNQMLIAVGLTLLGILVFAVIMTVLCFNYKAKKSKIKESVKSEYTNITAPDMKNQAATREPNMGRLEMISSDDLYFEDKSLPIGTGAFGAVYRGKWRVPKSIVVEFNWPRATTLDVAIKVIRSPSTNGGAIGRNQSDSTEAETDAIERVSERNNLAEMLGEAKVMASVQHKNCLRLIGLCITRQMQCMVSAFVELGSLDRYLQEHEDELNSFTLLTWAEQIADGMAYLEARGIIHRDLAARNVLVQSPSLVQITDFGLAKMLDGFGEDSIVVQTGRVPIRWLAIETLQSGIYSHKTDVWSYGVTLWEIFTFGKRPYENVKTVEIKDHVMKGGRLTQPDICTLDAYMVMVKCWMEDYESRPTFLELMGFFHTFCQTPGRYLYIQGDQYEINPSVPYTPSPAMWLDSNEMYPVSLSTVKLRGVPDGTAGDDGSRGGSAFRFTEGSTSCLSSEPSRMRGGERRLLSSSEADGEENEADSLLPHRRPPGRTTSGGTVSSSIGWMWRRPDSNAGQSTHNIIGAMNNNRLLTPSALNYKQPMQTYYNTSQLSSTPVTPQTGIYGGWVPPPPSAALRTDSHQIFAEAPTAQPEEVGDDSDDCFPSEAPPSLLPDQEDYLEPKNRGMNPGTDRRSSGDGERPFAVTAPWPPAMQSVTNPEYLGGSMENYLPGQQDYLQPSHHEEDPVA